MIAKLKELFTKKKGPEGPAPVKMGDLFTGIDATPYSGHPDHVSATPIIAPRSGVSDLAKLEAPLPKASTPESEFFRQRGKQRESSKVQKPSPKSEDLGWDNLSFGD